MSREPLHYLEDILRSCERISRYTVGMTKEQLAENDLTSDAVVRNLEVIGEAAKHISDDIRSQMPQTDWRKIAGMRDWLAHAYFRIDSDIVWDVVANKIPQLAKVVKDFTDQSKR